MPAPTAVTELQQKLFKRIGVDFPERQAPRQQARQHRGARAPLSGQQSRKLQRKEQRAQKRSDRYSGKHAGGHQPAREGVKGRAQQQQQQQRRDQTALPPRARGQKTPKIESEEEEEEEEGEDLEVSLDEDEDGLDSDLEGLDDEDVEDDDDDDDDDDDEDGSDDNDNDDEDEASDDHDGESSDAGAKQIPSAMRQKLAQDDAEIDEFERKLGIKKKSKSLPQAFKDDGLAELLGDLGGEISEEGGDDDEGLKRKRDYDDWLAAKRRKTSSTSRRETTNDDDDDADDLDDGSEDFDDDEGDDDEDALDDDAFEGFGSDDDDGAQLQQTRAKENPYKAPTTGNVVAKYVPPSLRKAQGTVSEARSRLQRQLQGQINRLTEANILSIVQGIEELYSSNARGDVTELLTNIILAQMQSPDSLTDQFFVLTGGFSAAIYKVIGSSFGSHLVREVARGFGQVYETCHKEEGDPAAIRKEASNMIAFLSQLYLFGVVGCKIIFDYMERFLENLSELNVELLLRVCRAAGQSLRKDDANALKHVTTMLGAAVAKAGYANVSARTKFMIETLNDLRNSKPKARGVDSAIVSDHVFRMRKRLGELKSRSRRLDGLAPMGVGLADIEQADTAGKWWLVGASVPAKEGKKDPSSARHGAADASEAAEEDEPADPTDDEDMDFVLPDYPKKARDQGLTTTAQIAIFTAVMSAMDYEHGYQRYVALGLKRDDQLEIARVLVQCVGSEARYNEYYSLVGRKACANARVRFAFQDRLWRIFRSLGESLFGGGAEPDAEETAESERMRDERRMGYVARLYAALVADGALAISVLKPLNFPEMNKWTTLFVESLVVALLRACRAVKGPARRDAQVLKVFGPAAEIPSLSAGLSWFLGAKLRKTKLASAEEMQKLDKVIKKARAAVKAA